MNLARLLSAALLGLALLSAVHYTGRGHDQLVAAFLVAFTAVAVAVLRWRWSPASPSPATVVDLAVVAFGFWMTVATLVAPAFYVAANGLLQLALFFLGYALVRGGAEGRDGAPPPLLLPLVAGGVGLFFALTALGAFFGGEGQPSGPFINRNNLVAFLFLASMFAGAALHLRADRGGVAAGACAAAGLLMALPAFWVLGLSGSRGALLGALTGLLLLVVLLRGRARAPVVPAGYAAGALTGLLLANLLTAGHIAGRVATLADPGQAGASRYLIWQSVLPLIAERPLFGHGLGTMFLVWPPHRHPLENTAGYHAHNDLLAFAVAGGIPAALLFTAMIAAILGTAYWASRRRPSEPATIRAAWVAAGLGGVALHAMFTFNFSIASTLLLAGLAAGYVAPLAPPLGPAWGRMLRVGRGVAAGVAVMLAVYAATSIVGYYHSLQMQKAGLAGDSQAAIAAASRAITWWPAADARRLQRADIIYQVVIDADGAASNPMLEGAYEQAVADVEAALRLNPYRPQGYTLAARITLAGGRLGLAEDAEDLAEKRLRQALTRNPRHLPARRLLSQMFEERGDAEAALAILMEGMHHRYPPTPARTRYHQAARDLATRLDDTEALTRIPAADD